MIARLLVVNSDHELYLILSLFNNPSRITNHLPNIQNNYDKFSLQKLIVEMISKDHKIISQNSELGILNRIKNKIYPKINFNTAEVLDNIEKAKLKSKASISLPFIENIEIQKISSEGFGVGRNTKEIVNRKQIRLSFEIKPGEYSFKIFQKFVEKLDTMKGTIKQNDSNIYNINIAHYRLNEHENFIIKNTAYQFLEEISDVYGIDSNKNHDNQYSEEFLLRCNLHCYTELNENIIEHCHLKFYKDLSELMKANEDLLNMMKDAGDIKMTRDSFNFNKEFDRIYCL